MSVSGNGTAENGLGGAQGYGEIKVPRGDDNSLQLDISAVFENGLNYFGTNYAPTNIFVNTNGTLSFDSAFTQYTTSQNTSPLQDMIAPFWGDVDTRLDGEGAESGAIWVDIDPVADVVSFTWYETGVYRRNAEDINTFQLQLYDRGSGDFDIVFRYSHIDWTIGTGDNDVGARVGLFQADATAPILIEPGEGHDSLQTLPDILGNTGAPGLWVFEMRGGEVENVATGGEEQIGTNANNVLTGTEFNDRLDGMGGDDVLNGEGGDDILNGGLGQDTLNGGADDDTLYGGDGSDRLTGGAGEDTLHGGEADDTAVFSGIQAEYTITENIDGTFTVVHSGGDHSDGTDTLTDMEFAQFNDKTVALGGPVSVVLIGTNGANTLTGGPGDDTLNGLDGPDILIGGAGNDTLIGGNTPNDLRDLILGGDGNDNIDGGYGNDELRGDAGNDIIAGGFGADIVIGGTGDDVLGGSAFSDLLFGGDGFDFINGGWGHDRINGGAGADRFFHLGIRDHGSDWIQDYNAAEGDVLTFGDDSAGADDFQVNFGHTETPEGERSGDDNVQEAFVIYRPTGQIMWALVDGAGQSEINIEIGGQIYDLIV